MITPVKNSYVINKGPITYLLYLLTFVRNSVSSKDLENKYRY